MDAEIALSILDSSVDFGILVRILGFQCGSWDTSVISEIPVWILIL